MSRATFSLRLASTRFIAGSLVAVMACLVPEGHLMAEEDEMVRGGREIFEKEWTYQTPEFAEVTRGLNDPAAQRRLSNLPGDGLGPMHNATSCEACHARGGAAGVTRNVTLLTLDPRNYFPALRTNSPRSRQERRHVRKAILGLYPFLLSPTGSLSLDVVVHEKSARPFYDAIRQNVGNHVAGGGAPDAWFMSSQRTSEAIAHRPVLAGRYEGLDYYLSQRNSPPLFGLGLIDRINPSRLQLLAKTQNRNTTDGVTGRIGVGKFGWRAQTRSLDLFVRGACAGEVGLQLRRTPQPPDAADETYVSPGIDLDEQQVQMLVSFVGALPTPVEKSRTASHKVEASEGKRLFAKIGCNTCHVESIHPARGLYSDLLLHDMGAQLQAPSPAPLGSQLTGVRRMVLPDFPTEDPRDGSGGSFGFSFGGSVASYYGTPASDTPTAYPMARPDRPRFPRGVVPEEVFKTSKQRQMTWETFQREWRTPPLWGVADSGPYMHDGRARTLDAAIRWHGGEAAQSVTEYRTLEPDQRDQVVAFLKSLRAPSPRPAPMVDVASSDAGHSQTLQALAESVDVFE